MFTRMETYWRHVRRFFNRSHWLRRLLRLEVHDALPVAPGLVLIQVDGLSRPQLEKALRKGEMPFLKKLLLRENYRLHTQYSGLPSSTPAVQAELFYGVKGAVPAFSFVDRDSGDIVRMYEPAVALKVEEAILAQKHEGLMKDGSSYSNCFKGGADISEAHFCASSIGWGEALRAANPLVLIALAVMNINSVLRIIVGVVIELVLAVVDFVKGVANGRNFLKELKFIPTRVAICIMLRELCVIGGKVDINRGLPIVQINFLGYDEQSHRRGPDSAFAHWTLKGIDDAIKRLADEAQLARWRHYEVWVYSDHGQCHSTSYEKIQGYGIEEAVNRAVATLASVSGEGRSVRKGREQGVETRRVSQLGGKRTQRLLSKLAVDFEPDRQQKIQVVGLGPVGFVHFPHETSSAELHQVAHELVMNHHVPLVVTGREGEQLLALTANGEYRLPQQTAELFGDDHPFLADIGEDLARICRHADAGHLTLVGWCKSSGKITFATENGSHAGLTHEETTAFSLLPPDAPLPQTTRAYHRPCDLREAVLRYLGRSQQPANPRASRPEGTDGKSLRIMTYNVHSCVGLDGVHSVERIARVIARENPDVVALQELDVNRQRTGGQDQAELIARFLEMNYHFHPSIHLEEEKYGDAILTRHPLRLVRAAELPGTPGHAREPRGALWVTVDVDGTPLHIINTHLGLSLRERHLQVEELLSNHWLAHPDCVGPVILCGDFNAMASSALYRRLCNRLDDAQTRTQGHRPRGTYYSRVPAARIDHIFINKAIDVKAISVPRTRLTLMASDHLPLIADLSIRGDLATMNRNHGVELEAQGL